MIDFTDHRRVLRFSIRVAAFSSQHAHHQYRYLNQRARSTVNSVYYSMSDPVPMDISPSPDAIAPNPLPEQAAQIQQVSKGYVVHCPPAVPCVWHVKHNDVLFRLCSCWARCAT
jgi:hypothetical protein